MIKRQRIYALFLHRFEDFFTSFFATNIIKGASLAASRLEADLMLHMFDDLNKFINEDWQYMPGLNPPHIDGIIFADINGNKSCLEVVKKRNVPFIVLNNCLKEEISCISIDNKHAAKEATEYLISLGHKKIATITGNLKTHAGSERLEGFKEALEENKINLPKDFIKNGDFMRSISRNSAEELLSLKEKPTAIFAASDVMAMEAIDVAKNKGIKVPKDLSVFGFDDFPMNIYSSVHLSTVSQPLEEMGRLGVEALNQIVSKKIPAPFKKVLKAKIIKRESCVKAS